MKLKRKLSTSAIAVYAFLLKLLISSVIGCFAAYLPWYLEFNHPDINLGNVKKTSAITGWHSASIRSRYLWPRFLNMIPIFYALHYIYTEEGEWYSL